MPGQPLNVRQAFFIGGEWHEPTGTEKVGVISPITEQVVAYVPRSTNADIDAAVRAARAAFDRGPWPRLTLEERAAYVTRLGELLVPGLEEAVDLQIDEMGGPRRFVDPATRAGVSNIPNVIKTAAEVRRREVRAGNAGPVVVARDPVGVVAGIIPWNGPVSAALGKVLPAILAGCSIVLKPAPETPMSALLVAEAADGAGLPAGVLNIVPGDRDVGEYLTGHPSVDHVSFTGSSAAGSRVAALCGANLKSVTLELGGKSAAIVLDDADLNTHLGTLIDSSVPNNGQVCFATTRILVSERRTAELVERLVGAIGDMMIGDPHRPDTAFGPLVSSRQRDRVESYIRSGRQQGAICALGGGRPAGQPAGWYVEPTVFTKVDNSMLIARDEIFGPVVCIISYRDEAEAIAIANDSEYGLGGAVFTSDPQRGFDLASQLHTGTCRVNEAPPGGGGGPFGGVKRSGLGRERAREGHEAFYDLKSISLPGDFDTAGLVMAARGDQLTM
jgi:aldehyde dehydrogenase (NAD+)